MGRNSVSAGSALQDVAAGWCVTRLEFLIPTSSKLAHKGSARERLSSFAIAPKPTELISQSTRTLLYAGLLFGIYMFRTS